MAETAAPPSIGRPIEVRRGPHILIGVVMWSSDSRFGVRLAEKVDVRSIIKGTGPTTYGEKRDFRARLRKGFG